MITADTARKKMQPIIAHPNGETLLAYVKARALADAEKVSIDIRYACMRGESNAYCRVSRRQDIGSYLPYTIYRNTLLFTLQDAGFNCFFACDGLLYVVWSTPE